MSTGRTNALFDIPKGSITAMPRCNVCLNGCEPSSMFLNALTEAHRLVSCHLSWIFYEFGSSFSSEGLSSALFHESGILFQSGLYSLINSGLVHLNNFLSFSAVHFSMDFSNSLLLRLLDNISCLKNAARYHVNMISKAYFRLWILSII